MTRSLLRCLTAAGLALTGCERAPSAPAAHGADHPRAEALPASGQHAAHDAGAAHAHAAPHAGTAARKLEAALHTSPSPARAGEPVTLALTFRDAGGAVVRDLTLQHEKPLHLLGVSRDLATFQHLHPEPAADGSYRVETRFPSGGEYVLFADYSAEGAAPSVQRLELGVVGAPRAPVALTESRSATQAADGLRLTLRTQKPLRAGGSGATLRFDVEDVATGQPVRDLEPYLGAMAHFVLISEDTQSLLHAHPLEAVGAGLSTVSAHTTFPRAGLYKLWVQLQRRGEVVTVPYVLRVQAGGAPAAPAHHAH